MYVLEQEATATICWPQSTVNDKITLIKTPITSFFNLGFLRVGPVVANMTEVGLGRVSVGFTPESWVDVVEGFRAVITCLAEKKTPPSTLVMEEKLQGRRVYFENVASLGHQVSLSVYWCPAADKSFQEKLNDKENKQTWTGNPEAQNKWLRQEAASVHFNAEQFTDFLRAYTFCILGCLNHRPFAPILMVKKWMDHTLCSLAEFERVQQLLLGLANLTLKTSGAMAMVEEVGIKLIVYVCSFNVDFSFLQICKVTGHPLEEADLHTLLFEQDFVAAMIMYYGFLRTCAGAEQWIPLDQMNGDKELLKKARTMNMKEGVTTGKNCPKPDDPKQDMQAVE